MAEERVLEEEDLVCKDCLSAKADFLRAYIAAYKLVKEEEKKLPSPQKRSQPEGSPKIEIESKKSKKEMGAAEIACKYQKIKDVKLQTLEDSFVKKQWIEYLCRCQECMKMYTERKLLFLFNTEEAPIHELLEYGSEDKEEQKEDTRTLPDSGIYDRLCQLQLGALPADRQHRYVNGYRKLVDSFMEHFKQHLKEGRVITKEEVEEFFEALRKSEE